MRHARTIATSSRPAPRTLPVSVRSAIGTFGLCSDDIDAERRDRVGHAEHASAELLNTLDARALALITGPSGAGKSTLLRALHARARDRGLVVVAHDERQRRRHSTTRVMTLFVRGRSPSKLARGLRILSAAGLADARLGARRVEELSAGERARLELALLMRQAEDAVAIAGDTGPGVLVSIDELCTGLDDQTARGVCATLARWARSTIHRGRLRVVCATSRDAALDWLTPDLLARVGLDGLAEITVAEDRRDPSAGLVIQIGSTRDYLALAPMHYRTSCPASIVRVLTARRACGEPVLGVLVVSMPTLNGAWRARAWPDLAPASRSPGALRAAARRLNDPAPGGSGVRRISRVIVDPRARGQGVGAALVRAYLADPLTPRTEAVAAMGVACPLFVRAGMCEWVLEHGKRDREMLRALRDHDLHAFDLVDIDSFVRRCARTPALSAALIRWASGSRSTRRLARGSFREIIRAAARSLCVPPRAYTASATTD